MSTIMAATGESRWGHSYFQMAARTYGRLRGAVGVPWGPGGAAGPDPCMRPTPQPPPPPRPPPPPVLKDSGVGSALNKCP